MGIPIKSQLVKWDIERATLKAFLQMFKTNYQNIRVQNAEPNTVDVGDLIDERHVKQEMEEVFEVLDIYERVGRQADFKNTKFWKREHENAPTGIRNSFTQRRVDELLGLYESIKHNGYVKKSGNLMKVIALDNLTIKEEPKWVDRITDKYYRLNGKRRCLICLYLGIERIIVSVVRVRIVVL